MRKILFFGKKNVTGPALRALRQGRQVTQMELVARMQVQGVNLDQKAVCAIESGRRMVADYELACFARALGVEVGALLSQFEENFPQ